MTSKNTSKKISANSANSANQPSIDTKKYWTYKRVGSKKAPEFLLDGKKIRNVTLKSRLKSIYIPPAYKNVVIAKSPNNPIQVMGTDIKGRRQYLYSSKHIKKQAEQKYKNVLSLGSIIIKLEEDNDKDIRHIAQILHSSPDKFKKPTDFMPIVIYMLRKYHFRIGNEKYTDDNNSYGITTLCKNHIKFTPNSSKFAIEFAGKKGVENSVEDDNKYMYAILKKLAGLAKGKDGYIFNYVVENTGSDTIITPEQVQQYLNDRYVCSGGDSSGNSSGKCDITPKMFRTWYANFHLLTYLRNEYKAGRLSSKITLKDLKQVIKSCCEYVSDKLNNTPSISKKSYIDNKIFDVILKDPVKYVKHIPEDNAGLHRYLYKTIKQMRD